MIPDGRDILFEAEDLSTIWNGTDCPRSVAFVGCAKREGLASNAEDQAHCDLQHSQSHPPPTSTQCPRPLVPTPNISSLDILPHHHGTSP